MQEKFSCQYTVGIVYFYGVLYSTVLMKIEEYTIQEQCTYAHFYKVYLYSTSYCYSQQCMAAVEDLNIKS
jgi:hypothetical protein